MSVVAVVRVNADEVKRRMAGCLPSGVLAKPHPSPGLWPEPEMIVRQRNRQGICRVSRFRATSQLKFSLNSHLHLFLPGMPAAGEHAFDSVWQVVMHRKPRFRRGQADDATGMPHQNGCLRESRVNKKLF
jgi:hypothetical protein